MHKLTEYLILARPFDLYLSDGTVIQNAYLAKMPGDANYTLAIKVDRDAVQVLDIHDDEILAAVDPRKVIFEC
jgi:hypothetical protein